jgi:hypothetical protein
MARNSQIVVLLWEGTASVRAAREAIDNGQRVEISLPQGTHHALFRHLNPEAARGMPESLDAEGGPEMLPQIATVAGLQEVRKLERPARRSRYRVRLSSPDPLLVLTPPPVAQAAASARRTAGR